MSKLKIFLFGTIRILLHDEPVVFPTEKSLALLTYLAVESGHIHRRELLAGLFWSDQPQEKAMQSLRQALSSLRRCLNDYDDSKEFLLIDRQTVRFNHQSDHWLDAAEFQKIENEIKYHDHKSPEGCLLCLRRLHILVDLYKGEFLGKFYLNDSSLFSEWTAVTAEAYHTRAIDALYGLSEYYERKGDIKTAIRLLRQQVALEPWREESHQALIRLLAEDGQVSAALTQYEQCSRILMGELGLEPASETFRLYEAVKDLRGAERQDKPASITQKLSKSVYSTQSFVGRVKEFTELCELIANPVSRLVTITGPGGVGKSRLAFEIADQHRGVFKDGVYFITLVAVNSAAAMQHTLAEGLGILLDEKKAIPLQLTHILQDKEMLLVLDNLEHLDGCGEVIETLIQRTNHIKIVVTSRERLQFREEWIFVLGGLDFLCDESNQHACEAVELFHQRATQSFFGVDLRRQATAISQICRLVEGLPLAIELAAAWVELRSCAEILDGLKMNLAGLDSPLKNMPPRQKSMRSTFDYSWERLHLNEQEVMKSLSVFLGGFTLEAAASTAGASPKVLNGLLSKSLVRLGSNGRYEIHELIRQFAFEKLEVDAATKNKILAMHARNFAEWMETQTEALNKPGQAEIRKRIALDIKNITSSWKWAAENKDVPLIEKSVRSLFDYLLVSGRYVEGISHFQLAADCIVETGRTPKVWGMLMARLGVLQFLLGRYDEAHAALESGLAAAIEFDDPSEQVYCLNNLARLARNQGRSQDAAQIARQALDISIKSNLPEGRARALFLLGQQSMFSGDIAACHSYCFEGLKLAEQVNNPRLILIFVSMLGDITCHKGEYQEAQGYFEKSLHIARELSDRFHTALQLNNLGTAVHLQENYPSALEYYQESLELCREIGDQVGESIALSNLGEVAFLMGELQQAQTAYDEGLAIGRKLNDMNSVMVCLNNLGEIGCERKDYSRARRNLREVLSLAKDSQNWLIATKAVLNACILLIQTGKSQVAAPFLLTLSSHTACEQETRRKVDLLLQEYDLNNESDIPTLEEAVQHLIGLFEEQ